MARKKPMKLSWIWFVIKYKLGFAREGVDFITFGQED